MPEERAEASEHCRYLPVHVIGKQNGGGSLEAIEQQRCCGQTLVAGAQNVGRADISGTNVANIAETCCAGQQQSEWY